jgi:hypothetical protein
VRPLIRNAFVFGFSCAISVFAQGQVFLQLNSRHFDAYEPIRVTIINQQARPISACVSEQWIPKPNDDIGVARTPLILQGKNGRQWATVLNGVDVGPPLHYVLTIQPHKSEEFQFQARGRGKARFVLRYWNGSDISVCDNPGGRKKAISPTFTLTTDEHQ